MYRTLVLCPGSPDKRETRRGGKVSAGCPAWKSKECNSPALAGPHRSTAPHANGRQQTEPRQRQRRRRTAASRRPKPTPGRKEPVEGGNDGTPSRSCPVQKRKNFVSRAQGPLRCAAWPFPAQNQKNHTRPCRAAPTGRTVLRVGLGRHRSAKAEPLCRPPCGWRGRRCPPTVAARQPTASPRLPVPLECRGATVRASLGVPRFPRGPPRSTGPGQDPDLSADYLDSEDLVTSGHDLPRREPEDLAGRSPDLDLLTVLIPKCRHHSFHRRCLLSRQKTTFLAAGELQCCRGRASLDPGRCWLSDILLRPFRGSPTRSDRWGRPGVAKRMEAPSWSRETRHPARCSQKIQLHRLSPAPVK